MRPSRLEAAFRSLGGGAMQCIREVLELLGGEFTLRDNVRFETVSVTFGGTANTESTIDISALKLKAVPRYILTLESSNGGVAYASSKGSWTATSIKAKCTVASTVAVLEVI